MGNLLASRPLVSADAALAAHAPDKLVERRLGSGRFMKTVRTRGRNGELAAVKIFVKTPGVEREAVSVGVEVVQALEQRLASCPRATAYSSVEDCDLAVILARPFFFSSLYDRFSTHPFLSSLERRWLAYQLVAAVAECHRHDVCHGDLKTENVMLSSWNGLFVTDFAPYKPALLPFDNPADFVYFFDTSSRGCCYLAPERFTDGPDGPQIIYTEQFQRIHKRSFESTMPRESKTGDLAPAMDVFSLGCVLAEIFSDGKPVFTLAKLVKYIRREMDIAEILEPPTNRIYEKAEAFVKSQENSDSSMTPVQSSFSPSDCSSEDTSDSLFDPYEPQLRTLILQMLALYPEDRPSAQTILERGRILGVFPTEFFQTLDPLDLMMTSVVENDDDQVPVDLGFDDTPKPNPADKRILKIASGVPFAPSISLLVLNLVTSCIRGLSYPCTLHLALELCVELSKHISDAQRLNRVLPYICWVLQNPTTPSSVRAHSIEALRDVMAPVTHAAPEDAYLFREVLLPIFDQLVASQDEVVKVTFARNVAEFARVSDTIVEAAFYADSRFTYSAEGSCPEVADSAPYPAPSGSPDAACAACRERIYERFLLYTRMLISDNSSHVKCAFLTQVPCLGQYIGQVKTNDVVVSHAITYLNDKCRFLRCEFFDCMSKSANLVGSQALQDYLLPLFLQALGDVDGAVVDHVLHALATLVPQGMLRRHQLRNVVSSVAPFLLHPVAFLRHSAATVLSAIAGVLEPLDVACLLGATLTPFLSTPLPTAFPIIPETLLLMVRTPLRHAAVEEYFRAKSEKCAHRLLSSEVEKIELLHPYLKPLAVISAAADVSARSAGLEPEVFTKFIALQPRGATICTEFINVSLHRRTRSNRQICSSPKSPKSPAKKQEIKLLCLPDFDSAPVQKHFACEHESACPLLQPADDYSTTGPSSYLHSALKKHASALVRAGTLDEGVDSVDDNIKLPSRPGQGVLVSTLETPKQPVTRIAFFEQAQVIVSASEDYTLRFWSLPVALENRTKALLFEHKLPDFCGTVGKPNQGIAELTLFPITKAHNYACEYSWRGRSLCSPHALHEKKNSYLNNAFVHRLACTDLAGNAFICSFDVCLHKAQTDQVLHLGDRELATSIQSYISVSEVPVLAIGTVFSRVLFFEIDALIKEPKHELRLATAHGAVLCIAVAKGSKWAVLGTSNGVLVLYDLRLHVQLRTWVNYAKSPVTALCAHPKNQAAVVVGVASGDISCFDVLRGTCTSVFTQLPLTRSYQPVLLPRGMREIVQSSALKLDSMRYRHGINAISALPTSNSIVFTGTDRIMRQWLLHERRVVTLNTRVPSDSPSPTYRTIRLVCGATILLEIAPTVVHAATQPPSPSASASAHEHAESDYNSQDSRHRKNLTKVDTQEKSKKSGRNQPEIQGITFGELAELSAHSDAICDIAVGFSRTSDLSTLLSKVTHTLRWQQASQFEEIDTINGSSVWAGHGMAAQSPCHPVLVYIAGSRDGTIKIYV